MNTLLFTVIVIVGVAFFLALAKGKSDSREFPYQLSKYLLSKAERSFYGVLVQAVGRTGLVFTKVRVADVITPRKGLNRSNWQRAFNAVSAKHFDFLVCNPQDCSVKIAVELDDSSHSSAKRKKRDKFLVRACISAGLPLLARALRNWTELHQEIFSLRQQLTMVSHESQDGRNRRTIHDSDGLAVIEHRRRHSAITSPWASV